MIIFSAKYNIQYTERVLLNDRDEAEEMYCNLRLERTDFWQTAAAQIHYKAFCVAV